MDGWICCWMNGCVSGLSTAVQCGMLHHHFYPDCVRGEEIGTRVDGRTNGLKDGWMGVSGWDGLTDHTGSTGRWMGGWMDERTDGWMGVSG